MTDHALPLKAARALPSLRTVHKVTALIALLWLTVLGLTGWILDHHEWRWTHQKTVPSSWTSKAIGRLVRGTILRKIEADPNDPQTYLGASERGTWRTADNGKTWEDVRWEDSDGRSLGATPQVYDMVSSPAGTLDGVWLATDDGIWVTDDGGRRAKPFALRGEQITSLTPGATSDQLVGVRDEGALFRMSLSGGTTEWISLGDVRVTGLPEHIGLTRFALDLHVGRGFLPQPWSTLINDFGGIALAILSLTGLLFWWLPRRWRGHKPQGALKSRQQILRWLFRGHGPVIGLLAVVPILYVSITGIAVDHIVVLLEPDANVPVSRAVLPPLYDYRNLSREVTGVVAFPNAPDRFVISSRFGLLATDDGGKTWAFDRSLPQGGDGTDGGRANMFRRADTLFIGIGGVAQYAKPDSADTWTELKLNGPKLAISDAARRGDVWYVKNSRAIYAGRLTEASPFEDSKIAFPALTGTTAFLFLADIHTGNVFHAEWRWINDLTALLAIVLALSGPILWWRRKWM